MRVNFSIRNISFLYYFYIGLFIMYVHTMLIDLISENILMTSYDSIVWLDLNSYDWFVNTY